MTCRVRALYAFAWLEMPSVAGNQPPVEENQFTKERMSKMQITEPIRKDTD